MVEAGEFAHGVRGSVKPVFNDIVMLEGPSEQQTLHDTNHELVHTFGRKVFSIKKRDDGGKNIIIQRVGYGSFKNNFFMTFNEAITEMINLETLAYCQTRGGVDYITGCDIGYPAAVIFFDMLINKLAERSGVSGQELRKDFYTGYFNGRFKYLHLFNQYLGRRALQEIADLPKHVFTDKPTEHTSTLFKKIFKEADLNYDEFVEKLNGYNVGENIKLHCGVEVSKNIQSSKT